MAIKNRRQTRSDKYQFLLLESACSHEMLSAFSNDDGLYSRLSGGFAYDERILELQDQLKLEFWRIVETMLTDRQKEVIKLYCADLTQQEIAKRLNVNQSSITKSLNGNVDYTKGSSPVVYGGTIRKIKKIIEEDPKVLKILEEIRKIREEVW